MKNPTRKELKSKGFRLDPMIPFNIRIPTKTRQKLSWKAEEEGIDVPDLIRSILAHAVRDVEPPKEVAAHVLTVSDDEWERIVQVAKKAQKSPEKLILQIVAKLESQI